MPEVGGQYAYIRDAYHPALGFLYGWAELFVIGAGGTAVVAVTFAKYFRELTQTTVPENLIAVSSVALLIFVNCLGVRAGSGVQSLFMVLRIVGVTLVVVCGVWFISRHAGQGPALRPLLDRPVSFDLLTVFGATMVPVMFAYGGWQTANFIASEIREPRKNLPRALLLGVLRRHRALRIGQFRLCLGAGPRWTSRDHHARFASDAKRTRKFRRPDHRRCNRDLHARILKPGDAYLSTAVLCYG